MFLRILSVVVFAAIGVSPGAQAQTVAQIGGPAENPPAGFKGQQYVDSRGCVFLKAGYGGRAAWVPRVSSDRKALCGLVPSNVALARIEMAEDLPAAAAPGADKTVAVAIPVVRPVTNAPMETIASLPQPRVVDVPPVLAPVAAAQPVFSRSAATRPTYEIVAGSGVPQGKIGCYTSVPVPQRVRLTDGGTAVVCTRGDGSLTGWRPPVYADNAGVGASLDGLRTARGTGSDRVATEVRAAAQDDALADADLVIPRGYKAAWTDDRLNPNRGRGTERGQAAQDQTWTREIPAQLVMDQGKIKKPKSVTVSTRNTATAAVQPKATAQNRIWLQVGTFGVPANAKGATLRLSALGLPVAKSRLTKGGKALEIVLAGPFQTAADAQAALSKARDAGFGDAFLR